MMKIEINENALVDLLGPFMKQVPFVASKSINDTLFGARKDQLQKMKTQIDGGPTAFTRRGLQYYKATKADPEGILYFAADRPYMRTIIEGGTVRPTVYRQNPKLVAPVKGRLRLTKQGNISKGRVRALKQKPNYFIGKPGSSKDDSKYGLYKIKGRGKNKKLERIVYMNLKARQQRPTYRGRDFAIDYVNKKLQRNILRAARRAIETAR